MNHVETSVISGAMRVLARDIESPDGVANAAIANAADRLDDLDRQNKELRDALNWYAQSSNWRREVRNAGPRRNWKKSQAAGDRGARAKFVLMTLEGGL